MEWSSCKVAKRQGEMTPMRHANSTPNSTLKLLKTPRFACCFFRPGNLNLRQNWRPTQVPEASQVYLRGLIISGDCNSIYNWLEGGRICRWSCLSTCRNICWVPKRSVPMPHPNSVRKFESSFKVVGSQAAIFCQNFLGRNNWRWPETIPIGSMGLI